MVLRTRSEWWGVTLDPPGVARRTCQPQMSMRLEI